MQGPSRAQRQEELEGAGDAIQIAQRLEILAGEGKGQSWSLPRGAGEPGHPLSPVAGCVPHRICPSLSSLYLCM